MTREEAFFNFMNSLFEMTRYVSMFENKLYNYDDMKLYVTEVHALIEIDNNKDINMTQLSQHVHRTKGAVSQMISKMEDMGLVIKKISTANKSEILLELTSKGKEVIDCHRKAEEKIFSMYLENLDNFDRRQINAADSLIENILNITKDKTGI